MYYLLQITVSDWRLFVKTPSLGFTEFSYATWKDSANIGMPSPPNLGGNKSDFISSLLEVIPPVTDGMNSVWITLSICRSYVNAP